MGAVIPAAFFVVLCTGTSVLVNHGDPSQNKKEKNMSVYCDVCTQPGSPNDDAGYTKNGGWLCPAHRQIEFTPEEKGALAKAITKAAVGIAQCWDVLLKISERIGRDWEPVDRCVADIADYCASSIDDPAAIELLNPDSVDQCFSDPENWKTYDEVK